jgi:secreted Zn-dependent insulinase-like peptidase
MNATLTFNSRALAQQFTKYWSRATLTGHTMSATGEDNTTTVEVYNVTDDSKKLINNFIDEVTP